MSLVVGDAAVQFAQERPAVVFVVFPRILAIEDDRHQSIAAALQEWAGSSRGCGRRKWSAASAGTHAGVDEADQIAEVVIAEDPV